MERFFPQEPNSARIFGNSQKIDLTLKLSLGGHGVQNSDEKFLARSSSIGGKISQNGVINGAYRDSSVVLPLERSCSLPAGAEKGLMRFGDLQVMRRAETGKRLLLEKQRRLALAAAEKEKPTIPPEMFALKAASVSKSPALTRAIDMLKALKNASGDSKHEGGLAEAGASSNHQTPHGQMAEAGASSNHQTQHGQNMVIPKTMVKETPKRPAETMMLNNPPNKKPKVSNPFTIEGDSMQILEKMPTVTTTGPNGKEIQGLLYKYLKGQVCIVCVCHGSFLTPAEFVKHAGGKETANPMKHINVRPGSF